MEYNKIPEISPSLYKPNCKLAQSILKRKFPFVHKPLQKGLWKI